MGPGPGLDELAFVWSRDISVGHDALVTLGPAEHTMRFGVMADGFVYLLLQTAATGARMAVRMDSGATALVAVTATAAACYAEAEASRAVLGQSGQCPEELPSLTGGEPVRCTMRNPGHWSTDVHSAPGVQWLNEAPFEAVPRLRRIGEPESGNDHVG